MNVRGGDEFNRQQQHYQRRRQAAAVLILVREALVSGEHLR